MALAWPELTLRIHYAQGTKSTGNDTSTQALIPIGRVNRSPKQRVPLAPENGEIVTTKKVKDLPLDA